METRTVLAEDDSNPVWSVHKVQTAAGWRLESSQRKGPVPFPPFSSYLSNHPSTPSCHSLMEWGGGARPEKEGRKEKFVFPEWTTFPGPVSLLLTINRTWARAAPTWAVWLWQPRVSACAAKRGKTVRKKPGTEIDRERLDVLGRQKVSLYSPCHSLPAVASAVTLSLIYLAHLAPRCRPHIIFLAHGHAGKRHLTSQRAGGIPPSALQ